jgi:hypothetical protein
MFLDAVNSFPALSATNKEKQAIINEKSEQQLFRRCVGAIDGYLHPITKPRNGIVMVFLKHSYWSAWAIIVV